jgi:hypothetical protein
MLEQARPLEDLLDLKLACMSTLIGIKFKLVSEQTT